MYGVRIHTVATVRVRGTVLVAMSEKTKRLNTVTIVLSVSVRFTTVQ